MIPIHYFLLYLLVASRLGLASADQGKLLVALSWGSTSETSSLLVMTCHSSRPLLPSSCCSAMTRAAESIVKDHPLDQALMVALTTQEAALQCERDGSTVPHVLQFGGEPSTIQFVYQVAFPQTPSAHPTNLYAWNDAEKSGIFGENYDRQSNETNAVAVRELFSNSLPYNPSMAAATLASELSQSGGMHRTLYHNLTLSFPDDTTTTSANDVLQLEATFLLLLPRDFFMDTEDAFENFLQVKDGTTTLHYDLSLQSHRTIDIEQPAFSSPQHAVLIRFVWRGSNDSKEEDASDVWLHFRFATKVHLRYPSPVPSSSSSSLYQPLHLVPPILLQIHLQHVRGFIPIQRKQQSFPKPHLLQFLLPVGSDDKTDGFPANNAEFITTKVASAPESDFVGVAIVTVLFSVLGAAWIGYETSRIQYG